MIYYLLSAIFAAAFVFETLVTGKLFFHRENLPVTGFMRWWAVVSLAFVSVMNIVGFLRLRQNELGDGIDAGNFVQAGMAMATLSLIAWVWVFHVDRWKKSDES